MPDPNEQTVFVNSSPSPIQTGTFVRDMLLVLSVVPTLIAVVGKRDLVGIVNYIGSSEFAPAAGVILGGAVIFWRQVIARRMVKDTVTLANTRPENVVIGNMPLISGVGRMVAGFFTKRG